VVIGGGKARAVLAATVVVVDLRANAGSTTDEDVGTSNFVIRIRVGMFQCMYNYIFTALIYTIRPSTDPTSKMG
jgi:hypothetical protein